MKEVDESKKSKDKSDKEKAELIREAAMKSLIKQENVSSHELLKLVLTLKFISYFYDS